MRSLSGPRPRPHIETTARLDLRGVSTRRRAGGRPTLDDVSLILEPGEALQVVGSDRRATSTLAQVAAGIRRPARGRVLVHGTRRYAPPHAPAPRGMTAREYLEHQARLQGVPARAAATSARETIERHDLDAAADWPLTELGPDWCKRCLLAQALTGHPDLVLLDEPWAGVDAESRHRFAGVLTALTGTGTAVLVTGREPVALPAMRWLGLHDGQLGADVRVAERPASTRTVTLAADAGAPRLAPTLLSAAGVVALHAHDDRARLSVTSDADGDRVLVALLQRGWTIEHLSSGEPR